MARPIRQELTVEQDLFARMEARGLETPEIIWELWKVKEKDDPNHYHNLECKLSRWRKHPKFYEAWMDEVRKTVSLKLMAKGLKKILAQVDSDEPWLANKAANDAVNFAKGRIFVEDENRVVVEFADGGSMPVLGTPDQDETDTEE